jgi:ABC-type nitrate/sulfonate/bicarbonate transport system substrate-binding protein
VAGWYETIAYMASHRDEAIRIAAEVLDLKPDIAARTFDYSLKGFSKDGHFGAPALKLLARSFVETGVLPKEPDMSKLYTTQFLPAAAK